MQQSFRAQLLQLLDATDLQTLHHSLNRDDPATSSLAVKTMRAMIELCRKDNGPLLYPRYVNPIPALFCGPHGELALGIVNLNVYEHEDEVVSREIITPHGIAFEHRGEIVVGEEPEPSAYAMRWFQGAPHWLACFHRENIVEYFNDAPMDVREFLLAVDPLEFESLAPRIEIPPPQTVQERSVSPGKTVAEAIREAVERCHKDMIERMRQLKTPDELIALSDEIAPQNKALALAQSYPFTSAHLPLLAFRDPLSVLAFEFLGQDDCGYHVLTIDDGGEEYLSDMFQDCLERYPHYPEYEDMDAEDEERFFRRVREELQGFQGKAEQFQSPHPEQWKELVKKTGDMHTIAHILSRGDLPTIPWRLLASTGNPVESVYNATRSAGILADSEPEVLLEVFMRDFHGLEQNISELEQTAFHSPSL